MCGSKPRLQLYDDIIAFFQRNPDIAAIAYDQEGYKGSKQLISWTEACYVVQSTRSVVLRPGVHMKAYGSNRNQPASVFLKTPSFLRNMEGLKVWYTEVSSDVGDTDEIRYFVLEPPSGVNVTSRALSAFPSEKSLSYDPFSSSTSPELLSLHSWEDIRKHFEVVRDSMSQGRPRKLHRLREP